MKDDVELPKLRCLIVLSESFHEYEERFDEATQTFILGMLENHKIKEKDRSDFYSASERLETDNDVQCRKLIKDYSARRKQVFRQAKLVNKNQASEMLEDLRNELRKMHDELLNKEVELVEQFEDFLREFEIKMQESTAQSLEIIHVYFTKLRDLESGFHDRLMTLSLQEMQKIYLKMNLNMKLRRRPKRCSRTRRS
eukprot:TRINITY_DN10219_c0_g1_i1.p1 TRINITY_DN10219_c0_g1~~TRINITY_DN10219_c0_g1_i1.p1  ORF type:complete len:215 (+),score=63.77 TRINITY_DN10219_c0_g1_i1:57-647(+)